MGKTLFIAEKSKIAVELLKSLRFRNTQKYPGSKPYYARLSRKLLIEGISQNMRHKCTNFVHINGIKLVL